MHKCFIFECKLRLMILPAYCAPNHCTPNHASIIGADLIKNQPCKAVVMSVSGWHRSCITLNDGFVLSNNNNFK